MRMLIVNADDFGINSAANEGIIACHQAGSVTSTTLMANGDCFEEAVVLAESNPSLAVGLHFNLTWGRPLSKPGEIPSLVDDSGEFMSRETLGRRALLGRLNANDLERELAMQYDRLIESGVSPSHIDSHQHVQAFGPVFNVIASFCAARSLPMRVPWVAPDSGGTVGRQFRRGVLSLLLRRSTRAWKGRISWNEGLSSIFDLGLTEGVLEDKHYSTLLERASGEVHELMVHPVTLATAMNGYTRVGDVGEAEFRYLRQGGLPVVAQESGFRLGTYRDISS